MIIPVTIGRWLFKYRSLTPLPMILFILFFFPPSQYGDWQFPLTALALVVSFSGEWIRVISVGYAHHGTSGRESFLRADALNQTGAYSMVRNPLYLGNIFMHSGLLLFWGNPYALVLMIVFLLIQYTLIVLGEEAYLVEQHGGKYTEYTDRVNRFLPCFRQYVSPEVSFNWRKVVVKENDSLFNMMVMFLLLMALREKHFFGSVMHGTYLLISGGVLLLLYVMVKIWKKSTPING